MDLKPDACPLPLGGNDEQIKEMLGRPRVVAVIGMSPKPERPSNEVGLFLLQRGFTVIPVHPAAEEICGLKSYASLEDIPSGIEIDIVDLFISGERTMAAVEQAAKIKAKVIWFQPGAEYPPSEEKARELGLEVVSGRCTKAEYQRLIGS
ncbi:MAG: CoA-binding protein [Planctomycetota bacterium]